MKKSLLKMVMLMSALLCSVGMWATDVTFNPASDQSFPKDGITLSVTDGTLTNGTDYRVYKNQTMTISSTVGNITNIALTYSSASYDGGGWAASYQPNATSWTSPTANGEQARITKLVVTVSSGGSTPTKYTVTIANDIANGTVTATPTTAEEGTEVTLAATPAFGCEFDSWSVTNASTSEAITVTNNKFTMPAANVNVNATFNAYSGNITTMSAGNDANIKFVTGSSSTTGAVWANSTPLTANNITLSGSVTSGTNYSYYDGSVVRFYANNNLVITPASGTTIEKIEIVRQSSASSNSGTFNCSGLTASNGNTTTNTNVFTGSATSAVTFTASAQARFTKIYVFSKSEPTGGPSLASISVKTAPTKVTYMEGDCFTPAGLVITKTFSDETTEDVTYNEETKGSFTFTPSLATELIKETSVTILYGGKSTTQAITVNPFTPASGNYNISLNKDLYAVSTGNNGTEQSTVWKGVTIVSGCNSNAGTKTYYDDSHIRYYIDSYLKLTAPVGYVINSVVFAEPDSKNQWDATMDKEVTVNTGTYTNSSKSWSGSSMQVDFSFHKQCRVASISVTYVAAPTSTDLTVSSAGYATFSSPYALNLDGMTAGYTAYQATGIGDGTVTLESVEGTVAANTGLVIKGAAGTCTIPVVASGTDITSTNKLVAVTKDNTSVPAGAYVLGVDEGVVKFLLTSNEHKATLNAGKSYLAAAGGSANLRFVFVDTETGIAETQISAVQNSAIYNLSGQRVGNDYKGIVIKNGRKVLVK